MRCVCIALIAIAVLSGCSEVAGTAALSEAGTVPKPLGKPEKTCRTVRAMATGFGEGYVAGLAESNLGLAIDDAKDQMATDGAKGFSVEARAVKCEGYIDFGGAIGREHKCHAAAQLCGRSS